MSDLLNQITDMLWIEGVVADFEEPEWSDGYCLNAGIDHAGVDDHERFVKCVLANRNRLMRYLFSEESFVLTGNDNSCDNVDIRAEYDHEEYYKGN